MRLINYLRVSITDRCNFRCVYCMPPGGVKLLSHDDILSYEEILRIISIFGSQGINKIRITGGEPLVRKGVVEFVRSVSALKITPDLSMTTNGSFLEKFAHSLKAAGLTRVNISLDTFDSEKFSDITGGGRLGDVLTGIESALDAKLGPVKLNVVLTEHLAATDLLGFIDMVYRYPVAIRFIEYMPIGSCQLKMGITTAEVKKIINSAGCGRLEARTDMEENGPARYYQLPRAKGMFGFITPLTDHFCNSCNRIRLTADGKIKPCLLSAKEIDIRKPLRAGATDAMLADLLFEAVAAKPRQHSLCRLSGYTGIERRMSQIGG